MRRLVVLPLLGGASHVDETTWAPEMEWRELHGGEVSWDGQIRQELNRSISEFPAPTNEKEIAEGLGAIMDHFLSDRRLLILRGRLFAHSRFLDHLKNRMYASMILSLKRTDSVSLLHNQGSFGTATKRHKKKLPTTVIAKKSYRTSGILVPNPFFGNGKLFTKWDDEVKEFTSVRRQRHFLEREDRVFWRGEIGGNERKKDPCLRESGNYDRLRAAALTLSKPDVFDVRCTKCKPRIEECPGFVYNLPMRRAISNPRLISAPNYTQQIDFAGYRYLLNLPGKTAGSYSRNLNHLWYMGSVIFTWDSSAVEFYYPPLRHGVTHLSVNASNINDILHDVQASSKLRKRLVRNSKRVANNLVCPKCLARYLGDVLDAWQHRFQHAAILNDPHRAPHFLKEHLPCDDLREPHYELSLTFAAHIRGGRELGERRVDCNEIFDAAAGHPPWTLNTSKSTHPVRLHDLRL